MSDSKRVFSDQEAADVLKRAARLQEERGESAYAPGVTHEELVRIAIEAGIDPENIEAAIRAASVSPPKRSFLNLIEENERVVDAELDPSQFDVILDAVKPSRSHQHPVGQVGRTLTFQTRYKGSLYAIEVVARNGRTRIRVTSNPFVAYITSLHPAILLSIFGAAAIAPRGYISAAALFALVTMMVGTLAFIGLVRRGNSKTGELADLLERTVREAAAPNFDHISDSGSTAIVEAKGTEVST